MEQKVDNCLDDLEKQILEEEISYQFYEKAVNSVKFISPQKQFKEMMWEEFNHVKVLKDKYAELGGNKQVTYNTKLHGGLALPSNEIDTEVAIDIGVKEELESIAKYETLLAKYKDHNLFDLFNCLMKDERKHLLRWEMAQIEYLSKPSKLLGKSTMHEKYRFTATDLDIIDEAVKYWDKYSVTLFSKVKCLHNVERREIMISIIKKEHEHRELLQNEYFRLKGTKSAEIKDLQNSQSAHINNDSMDEGKAIDQIIDGEKNRVIRLYDWGRMCTNSQLQKILWSIMDDKYLHLKQWTKIPGSVIDNP